MSRRSSVVDTVSGVISDDVAAFPVVRHPFSRRRVHPDTSGASLTHQSHADSCDINKIIQRYERTGELPPPTRPPSYADVTGLQGDLTERFISARSVIDESLSVFASANEKRATAKASAKAQAEKDAFEKAVQSRLRDQAPPTA